MDKVAPFDLGTTAKYVCDLGYGVIEGADVRTCVKDGFNETGLWSGAAPTCDGKSLYHVKTTISI